MSGAVEHGESEARRHFGGDAVVVGNEFQRIGAPAGLKRGADFRRSDSQVAVSKWCRKLVSSTAS